MSESMLQKDFKSSDVNRMRNLISKNYGDKTVVQVGYVKSKEEHKEGDIWEENGKKWTIKNGVKQSLTRFDELKKALFLPLTCPSCGKPIKESTLNKKMYSIHKKCANCVIEYETKLKVEGKYDEYQKSMIIDGVKSHIKDLEEILLDINLNGMDESIVTESGDVENWVGGDMKEKVSKELQDYIIKLKELTES